MSSSSSAGRTLRSSSASWARVSSSQNTAGVSRFARARDREPDPILDRRVLGLAHAPDVAGGRPRARAASRRRRRPRARYPARAISNVLSCDPYSSAAWAIRPMLGVLPIFAGIERAVARGNPRPSRRTAARRSGRGSRTSCPAACRRAFHICPEDADRRRHRRVDDHVAGDVEVRDPAVRVDHRQRRAASRMPPRSRSRSRPARRRAAPRSPSAATPARRSG